MAGESYTVINAMVDIIASPTRALDEVRDRVRWLWVPLLLLVGVSCGAFIWYYDWVDFEWLVEEQIRALPAESRAEAAPGVRSFMSPTTLTATTVASIVVMTLVLNAVFGAYYHLVAKLGTNAELRYGQWFSLSVWAGFPGILNALAIVVVMLLADSNQLGQAELSPLSFNQLFIHAEPGDAWFNWGNSVNLIQFWSVFLAGLGFARWTGSSLAKGLLVTATPLVLVFGIWAALI